MTPEMRYVYNMVTQQIDYLTALCPIPGTPECRLLMDLEDAIEEYERAERNG